MTHRQAGHIGKLDTKKAGLNHRQRLTHRQAGHTGRLDTKAGLTQRQV